MITLTIETASDADGNIEPMTIDNTVISQLGMYTVGDCKIWVVPSSNKREYQEYWLISDGDKHFHGFSITNHRLTFVEGVRCGIIYNDRKDAEKALAILKILSESDKWQIV